MKVAVYKDKERIRAHEEALRQQQAPSQSRQQ